MGAKRMAAGTDGVAVHLARRVPVAVAEVHAALAEGPAALLGAAGEAGQQRCSVPLSVRFAGVRSDRQAAIGIGPVVVEADGTRLLPLWWEAAEHPELFPTFDGGLQVCPHDRGTELRLEGHYRPPLGAAGGLVNRAVLHRAATASLEAFLDRLAARLVECSAAVRP